MRNLALALVATALGVFDKLRLAHPLGRAGRYGPFYRTGSTQDDATTQAQLDSGEFWGRPNRGADRPSVDAWNGPLPDGKHGVEFWTDVEPSPGSPPGRSRWLGPRPGVECDAEWARIRGTITKTRFIR